jgi:hypothetical protein
MIFNDKQNARGGTHSMFSRLRPRLTYANVAATLALVFAMSSGAYAASKFLITSTKQIKPSVLKQLQGKAGAAGAQGPAGLAGPQGLAGGKGENGAPGANGTSGKDGVSVTSANVPKSSSTCSKLGGAEFTSANGSATACNGKEGSPWTAGGTLPSGQTETGTWAFGPVKESPFIYVPVASFAIPLANSLSGGQACEQVEAGHVAEACHVHYINASNMEVVVNLEEEVFELTSAQCLGTVTKPAATLGNLCVYTGVLFNATGQTRRIVEQLATEPPPAGAGTTGAVATFKQTNAGAVSFGSGTWAVTAG